jgi:hypothetical protein
MQASTAGKASAANVAEFNLDEVILLKGHCFKIVLVDGYTGKIGLKWITAEEAGTLEKAGASSRTASVGTMGAGHMAAAAPGGGPAAGPASARGR